MLLLSTFKLYEPSGSTDIPVRDSAWHTDYSRTSSAISDDTELISRVSLLVY